MHKVSQPSRFQCPHLSTASVQHVLKKGVSDLRYLTDAKKILRHFLI